MGSGNAGRFIYHAGGAGTTALVYTTGMRVERAHEAFRLRPTLLCVFAWLAMCACGGRREEVANAQAPQSTAKNPAPVAAVVPAQAPAPATPPPEAPLLSVQRTRELMGTIILMTIVGLPEERAAPALTAAMAEIERLEGLLSEWREDSEISRINQAAGKHPVKVSEDTLANVRVANAVSKWSDGAFDLSWAALRGLYLFNPGEQRIPTDKELAEKLPLVNYKDIIVDEKAHTVFLRRKGMLLGTGGIAKGYALEKAAEVLDKLGIQNYMFFGGGQIVVHGKKGPRGWRVGVQHPRMDDYFAFIEAERGSIATSGDYEHAFIKDGKRWHHIIDLKTGRPVEHTAAVTVISDSPFYADAIDTALFIMGPEKALAKLPSAPGPKAEVLIIDKDMGVHMSPGMQKRLIMRMELTDGKLPLH
jgi:FAD:protein FMN transferase